MTDRYAVVGNPVAHSLSPRIHRAFAQATGESLSYDTLLAPLDDFAGTVESFFASGGAGLNVTVPFKADAARWVGELAPAARAAGAVNTITRHGAGFRGHNTDGAGLLRDLTGNCGIALHDAEVLLLGAGGAAQGVVRPLLEAGPRRLVVANRTVPRAEELVAAVRRDLPGAPIEALALSRVAPAFDLVISATSAGLGTADPAPGVDPAVVTGAFCYDMIYAAPPAPQTAFCRWAASHGAARVADGLGMLVEQAALAFALWRGVTPSTGPVLELFRRERV